MSSNPTSKSQATSSFLKSFLPILVLTAVVILICTACVAASPTQGMVYIPAGKFSMGSVVGFSDEQPAHEVYLDAYWMDKTEVTNAMYKRCMDARVCTKPADTGRFDNPSYADHPVASVSWVQSKAYCIWAGRRLPTEAEWEKAASWDSLKNEKRKYPWGNEFDCKKGNFTGSSCDGYEQTAPVGSFPSGASAYGVLDMGGNVWEWVNDAFLESDPFVKGQNYYAESPPSNPQGIDPSTSAYRVMRGGAWKENFGSGTTTYRLWFGLDDSYNFAGFRCARSE